MRAVLLRLLGREKTNEVVEIFDCGGFDHSHVRSAHDGRRPKEGRPETIRTESDQKPASVSGSTTEIRRETAFQAPRFSAGSAHHSPIMEDRGNSRFVSLNKGQVSFKRGAAIGVWFLASSN